MQPVGRPCSQTLVCRGIGAGSRRPSSGAACTGPNDGAVSVTNSSGFAATISGTVLPPVTPAVTIANVSRA